MTNPNQTHRVPDDKWKAGFIWLIVILGVALLGVSAFMEIGRKDWPEEERRNTAPLSSKKAVEQNDSTYIKVGKARTLSSGKLLYWNVRNYFVEGNAMGETPKPEEEREGIAEVIAVQDADVVALAEMSEDASVKDILARLNRRGKKYAHVEKVLGSGGGRGLVLLSRLPVTERHSRREVSLNNGKGTMIRGILDVMIGAESRGGYRVVLVHLKSKYGEETGNDVLRRAEADALKEHLRKIVRNTNVPVIVCGDMNDSPASPALRAIMGAKYPGRTLSVLRATDDRGQAWTYHYGKEDQYSRIDYMMVLKAPTAKGGKNKFFASIPETNLKHSVSDHRPILLEIN